MIASAGCAGKGRVAKRIMQNRSDVAMAGINLTKGIDLRKKTPVVVFSLVKCSVCGDLYPEVEKDRPFKYCSPECRNQNRRESLKKSRAARSRRVKAASRGKVDRYQVFERDGWACWICGAKTRRYGKQTHPRAATIDHVVPVSKGGFHSMENVRCACFECNNQRQAKIVPFDHAGGVVARRPM